MKPSATLLRDERARARAIAAAEPFCTWPEEPLLQLARAARVVTYRRGAVIQAQGTKLDALVVVVEGSVQASAQNLSGRRYTFVLVRGTVAYGLLPLVDGQEIPNDMIAAEPLVALVIPFDAIRAELARAPALWESLAIELALRARLNARNWTRLALLPLRARAAAVLLGLAESTGAHASDTPVTIGVHLPQERLGEMLGVSRQTATALARDLTEAGVLRWHYGRVTVLDLRALREIAEERGEPDEGGAASQLPPEATVDRSRREEL
jgi:CRP-like cAMP-binding protein